VTNPNNFLAGATVTVATPGIGVFGPFTGSPATIVDNLAATTTEDLDFIFNNTGADNRLSVTNFGVKAGAVDLRFFIAPEDGQRVPASVRAYAWTANQTSTNLVDYSLIGSRNVSGPYSPYDIPADTSGDHRGYFDLLVNLPAGTQSLAIDFTASLTGVRLYELQALPVPEPGTCVLLAFGTVGLLAAARRRRSA
jgi:PEP-CTERM motif